MNSPTPPTIVTFARGRSLFQIATAFAGKGYVGLRDGRVVARGEDRAAVARMLILGYAVRPV